MRAVRRQLRARKVQVGQMIGEGARLSGLGSRRPFHVRRAATPAAGAGLSIVVLLASLATAHAQATGGPTAARSASFARALWVVRHDVVDRAAVEEVVARAAALDCTDLLIQVRGRADAYHTSRLSPPGADLVPGFDALAAAVELGAERGLRVHAWMNVLLAWSAPEPPARRDHLVHRHPDWFLWIESGSGRVPTLSLGRHDLDRLGIEGHFLNPALPEVRAHLERVVREVAASYAVDGIHLDYIRYPDGQTGSQVESPAAAAAAAAALSNLVARLAETARRTRPGLLVSAAVYPDVDQARKRKGQSWDDWVRAGHLDFAVPMCYGPTGQAQASDLRAARRVAGHLWAGVALYNKPLEVVLLGVEEARRAGFQGVAIFAHANVRELGRQGESRLAGALREAARHR